MEWNWDRVSVVGFCDCCACACVRVQAPCEAEAQCAALAKAGKVWLGLCDCWIDVGCVAVVLDV